MRDPGATYSVVSGKKVTLPLFRGVVLAETSTALVTDHCNMSTLTIGIVLLRHVPVKRR